MSILLEDKIKLSYNFATNSIRVKQVELAFQNSFVVLEEEQNLKSSCIYHFSNEGNRISKYDKINLVCPLVMPCSDKIIIPNALERTMIIINLREKRKIIINCSLIFPKVIRAYFFSKTHFLCF